MAEIDMIGRLNLNMPSAFELVPVGTNLKMIKVTPIQTVTSIVWRAIPNQPHLRFPRCGQYDQRVEADSLEQIGLIPTGSYPNEIELDRTRVCGLLRVRGLGESWRTGKSVIAGAART